MERRALRDGQSGLGRRAGDAVGRGRHDRRRDGRRSKGRRGAGRGGREERRRDGRRRRASGAGSEARGGRRRAREEAGRLEERARRAAGAEARARERRAGKALGGREALAGRVLKRPALVVAEEGLLVVVAAAASAAVFAAERRQARADAACSTARFSRRDERHRAWPAKAGAEDRSVRRSPRRSLTRVVPWARLRVRRPTRTPDVALRLVRHGARGRDGTR